MKVRYTATALVETNDIFAYIAERNPQAAAAVIDRVQQTIAALARSPFMAQETEEPNVRRMPVGRYPFVVFYAVDQDEVVILHVRHGARKPPWEANR